MTRGGLHYSVVNQCCVPVVPRSSFIRPIPSFRPLGTLGPVRLWLVVGGESRVDSGESGHSGELGSLSHSKAQQNSNQISAYLLVSRVPKDVTWIYYRYTVVERELHVSY